MLELNETIKLRCNDRSVPVHLQLGHVVKDSRPHLQPEKRATTVGIRRGRLQGLCIGYREGRAGDGLQFGKCDEHHWRVVNMMRVGTSTVGTFENLAQILGVLGPYRCIKPFTRGIDQEYLESDLDPAILSGILLHLPFTKQ